MANLSTFYLSRIIGKRVYDTEGKKIGIVKDLLVDTLTANPNDTPDKPRVIGVKTKTSKGVKIYSFEFIDVFRIEGRLTVKCNKIVDLSEETINNGFFLAQLMLDKQIVDLNGRKLVRVNDIRLVDIKGGTFAVAVDIGIEGLLRRIDIEKPIKFVLSIFNVNIPAKYIIWDDVQAIDFSSHSIKLSKVYSKLNTLHPSDLADIIEDLGRATRTSIFSALDEEHAADVLEELEPDAQLQLVESLPVDKMADVLEKMPADEVADILDGLEDEKAESLLMEMEAESSQEVRELLEYEDDSVGSIMTTDILAFNPTKTVEDVIKEIRARKPEAVELYNLFVTDAKEELIGFFTLRDLIVSEPETTINQIMKEEPIYLYDDQGIDDIAEIISKYNLLAIPVIDKQNLLQGMVVIDDVVEDLVNKRRTFKR
jgi:CBS domain-containing protein/sporulation protein YlmC with PRC-barrel domain